MSPVDLHPMLTDPRLAHLPYVTYAEPDPNTHPTVPKAPRVTRSFRLKPRAVFRLRPFAGPADGGLARRLETYGRLAAEAGPRFLSVAVLVEPPTLCSAVTT